MYRKEEKETNKVNGSKFPKLALTWTSALLNHYATQNCQC